MIVHVTSSIAVASAGPTYTVVRLCEELIAAGEDVALATLDDGDPGARPPFTRAFPRGGVPRRLGRSPAMRRWLRAAVHSGRADIVHSHGLWQMSTVYPAWAVRKERAVLIAAPHGTLAPWAMRFGSHVKRVF